MSEHIATVRWQRGGAEFLQARYSRKHEWRFDGGVVVPAAASPLLVRAPWTDPAGVDPEEGYVAVIASCHMLWFLFLAAKADFLVESYDDDAVGTMGRTDGPEWVTDVALRPRIVFGGDKQPDAAAIAALHEDAHHHCFIANSVKTRIHVEAPV